MYIKPVSRILITIPKVVVCNELLLPVKFFLDKYSAICQGIAGLYICNSSSIINPGKGLENSKLETGKEVVPNVRLRMIPCFSKNSKVNSYQGSSSHSSSSTTSSSISSLPSSSSSFSQMKVWVSVISLGATMGSSIKIGSNGQKCEGKKKLPSSFFQQVSCKIRRSAHCHNVGWSVDTWQVY